MTIEEVAKGTISNCKLCRDTPVPSSFDSARLCAFDASGKFNTDNWNCCTFNYLRLAAGEGWTDEAKEESLYLRRNDHSYAAIWIPPHPEDVPDGDRIGPFRGGGFIVMAWYKHRGKTDVAIRVDGYPSKPLTMEEAEAAVENLAFRNIFPSGTLVS